MYFVVSVARVQILQTQDSIAASKLATNILGSYNTPSFQIIVKKRHPHLGSISFFKCTMKICFVHLF